MCMFGPANSRDLIEERPAAGWVLDRVKGSHQVFRHRDRRHVVTVPHPKKDLGPGLVNAIRKQSGIQASEASVEKVPLLRFSLGTIDFSDSAIHSQRRSPMRYPIFIEPGDDQTASASFPIFPAASQRATRSTKP